MEQSIKITDLMEIVANNFDVTSSFLSPKPTAFIPVITLVEEIAKVLKVQPEEIGIVLNGFLEERERKKIEEENTPKTL